MAEMLPNSVKEKLAAMVIKDKVAESKGSSAVVTLKTGGQPLPVQISSAAKSVKAQMSHEDLDHLQGRIG